jgi:hypothetical protein
MSFRIRTNIIMSANSLLNSEHSNALECVVQINVNDEISIRRSGGASHPQSRPV